MSQLNDGENGWIENCINNRIIKLYQFSTSEIQKGRATIEESGSMVVLQAILQFRDIGQTHFYNSKEFAAEVAIHHKAKDHPNIIRVFGITKDLNRKYFIVLEHADGGPLFKFLKEHSDTLSWKKKNQLALDITKGLDYLHNMEVLHKNLTSDTVHVHNGTAKISAFGLSRLDRKSAINLKHNSAYTDVLYSITQNYKHNKKSDVYSLGVLLWEISGGIPSSDSDLNKLTPVEGTPDDYIELYKQCRDRDLVKRLTCKEILRKLEDILRRNDLMKIDNEDLILRPSENHLYTTWLLTIIEKQTTRGRIDHHARNFVINWLTNNNYDVENILNTLRRHDETCGHCCALIGFFYHVGVGTSVCYPEALRLYKLSADKNIPLAEYCLGQFYEFGYVDRKKDRKRAFEFYQRAAGRRYPPALWNLGYCYEKGIGVSRDMNEAVRLYKDAVDLGHVNALHSLGQCYEKGNGVEKNIAEAKKLKEQAASAGFVKDMPESKIRWMMDKAMIG